MRLLPSSLLFAFVVSLSVIPVADARTWSPLGASLTRYDIRAAVKAKKTTAKKRPASVELPAIAKGGLLFGDKEATTTIVMFTDIECPFCKRFHEVTYPDIQKEFIDTKKVRFVVRHFPLSFHMYASMSARAVMCSREKGDEYARSLYNKLITEDDLDAVSITAAIGEVKGLDLDTVTACIDGKASKASIEADMKAGSDAGVMGTPAFFVIGPTGTQKQINGAYPFDTFKDAIQNVQPTK